MKEEQNLINKCGKGNPFTVPQGFFEEFADHLMEQLPSKEMPKEPIEETPRVTLWQRVQPLLYMAAMFIGMILCVRVVLGDHLKTNKTESIAITNENGDFTDYYMIMSDEELAATVEYTMMDHYSLYKYLTEAE